MSFINALVKVTTEALVNALDGTQTEVEHEKISNTLVEGNIEAIVDGLAETLSKVEAETLVKNNRRTSHDSCTKE